jgi:hypothetical protein
MPTLHTLDSDTMKPLEQMTKAELITECRRLRGLLSAFPPGVALVPAVAPVQAAPRDEELVLQSLRDAHLSEGQDALISVTRLRAVCHARNFDAAVIHLYEAGIVGLHYHDFPMSLSPQERAQLVEHRGVYFIGIYLRR